MMISLFIPVTLMAGELPVYQPYEGSIRSGVVINAQNWSKYLPELKKLLPSSKIQWYGQGVQKGYVTIPIKETRYFKLSKGVLDATKKYEGQCKTGPNNSLIGWVAGVPFPNPANGLELAWNCYSEISRASSHDDTLIRFKFVLFKGDKYEKRLAWQLRKKKYMGRCDIPPMPCMPEAETVGIASKESVVVTSPHEVKGFIQLRIRYWDLENEDECYAYIPAIRRVRRLTGSDLTDPLLGSDCVVDDFEVWRQKLDDKMTFRILEKRDFLVPQTYLEKPPYDFEKNRNCFPIDWEIRPLIVLELMTNNPDYVYSKRIIYVDAVPLEEGGTFILYWGDQYDQKGRLWKSNGQGAPTDNGKGFKNLFAWLYMNCQSNHYTIMDGYPEYCNLDPSKSFSIKGLLRMAR